MNNAVFKWRFRRLPILIRFMLYFALAAAMVCFALWLQRDEGRVTLRCLVSSPGVYRFDLDSRHVNGILGVQFWSNRGEKLWELRTNYAILQNITYGIMPVASLRGANRQITQLFPAP